jgi:hypothetical protein
LTSTPVQISDTLTDMDGYRELLAKWVLQELAPETVPDLAVSALERGCDQLEVALLAGLRDPTYGDVDELVNKLLGSAASCVLRRTAR